VHEVVPPRRASAGPPPGLLLLHGRGADEWDLLGLAEALDPRLLIVSARALYPMEGLGGYHWYEFLDIGTPEPDTHMLARARLFAFAGELVAAYGIDPARLYALGFSQGAVMVGGLLLETPPALAGAVLLSGYMPPGAWLRGATVPRDCPVLVAHGARDPLVPVALGRRAADRLRALGADVTYREYPIVHTISQPEVADIAAWLAARLDAAPAP
jgi:phospholipase/carboxylesterase